MDTIAFVEVLDAGGQAVARHRVAQLPAVIGRGYESDVVLDDPHVDPRHARLWRDDAGRLRLDDLGSVNGIVDGAGTRLDTVVLGADSHVRLGRSTIRIRQPGDSVAPARALTVPPSSVETSGGLSRRARLGSPAFAVAACAVAGGVFALDSYLGSTERVTGAGIMGQALGLIAALAVWAGCWALASRLLIGRFRFGEHLALASIAMAATICFYVGMGYLAYLAPPEGGQGLLSLLAGIGIFAALLHAHLGIATALPPRRRSGVAVGIAAALTLLVGLGEWAGSDDFDTTLDYSATIKPIRGDWVRSVTLDRFLEQAGDLRTEVDEMARTAEGK